MQRYAFQCTLRRQLRFGWVLTTHYLTRVQIGLLNDYVLGSAMRNITSKLDAPTFTSELC